MSLTAKGEKYHLTRFSDRLLGGPYGCRSNVPWRASPNDFQGCSFASGDAVSRSRLIIPRTQPSVLETLAAATNTSAADWEDLDGPDTGVGAGFRYRHRSSGAEACLNLDQDHVTISVDGDRVYPGLRSLKV